MRDTNVAEILVLCRDRAKLTQQELADKLFVDQAIVSKVENGKIVPSYTMVKAWAQATGGSDLLGMDFVGQKGYKRLKDLEDKFEQIKGILQVQFLRIKPRRREISKNQSK